MNHCIHYRLDNGEAFSVSAFSGDGVPACPPGSAILIVGARAQLPGHVVDGLYIQRPKQPSPDHTWDITEKAWVFAAQAHNDRLAKLTLDALDAIDQAAGTVRLRYITSVPGQAETYQRKEQQAREWKAAGFTGTPPVFVAAEAQALGQDPVDVANYIIETADQWGNFKGPQIEATRRKWKVAIDLAGTDEAAIVAAREAGIAELMTL